MGTQLFVCKVIAISEDLLNLYVLFINDVERIMKVDEGLDWFSRKRLFTHGCCSRDVASSKGKRDKTKEEHEEFVIINRVIHLSSARNKLGIYLGHCRIVLFVGLANQLVCNLTSVTHFCLMRLVINEFFIASYIWWHFL